MPGHLAAEQRALLAHARLEEGVADAVDVRRSRRRASTVSATAREARTSYRIASPGLLAQQRLGEQRGEEVAVDERAGVVDEEAAVRVAVPGDAQVRAARAHPLDDQRRFSGSSGLGSWSGKLPSGVQ